MPETWIWLTVAAALLQSIRTAGQKQLTGALTVLAGTYVRALIGLPVMLIYLGIVKVVTDAPWPPLTPRFFFYAALTALTQLGGSASLLMLYRHRNFAVANQLGKTDLIFTALIGTLLFGQHLSAISWIALAVTGAGVATLMSARAEGIHASSLSWRSLVADPSIRIGLIVGLMFGVCNLTLREATLSLPTGSRFMAGALTVATVTAIQALVMGAWLSQREPGTHRAIAAALPLSVFVGVTSALGSIGWFTAFAMETAAHVRIVGQIEVVFTILISTWYFRERILSREALGIAITIAGILLLQAMA